MTLQILSGWASDCAKQPPDFLKTFLKNCHFFSFQELISGKEVSKELPIIAWSLGAHFVPEDISAPVILLNPALDFCSEQGGWHPKIIHRMIKQLPQNKTSVLQNFAERLSDCKEFKETWLGIAEQIPTEFLCRGLEHIQRKKTFQCSKKRPSILCIHAENDTVCNPEVNRKICELEGISYSELPNAYHEIHSPLWCSPLEKAIHEFI